MAAFLLHRNLNERPTSVAGASRQSAQSVSPLMVRRYMLDDTRIDKDALARIFDLLKDKNRSRAKGLPMALGHILEQGWALSSQLDDYGEHYDSRMASVPTDLLLDFWGLPVDLVASQPKYLNTGVMLRKAVSAATAAALFIRLEEFGFEIDPAPLVSALLPLIKAKKFVSNTELDVLNFARRRDRASVELMAAGVEPANPWNEEKFKDSRGTRLKLIRCAGLPYRLEAKGAKYRYRPPGRVEKCEYCGCQFTRNDPESRDNHQSLHAQARRLLDPTPSKDFAKRLQAKRLPELVDVTSPMWMHRSVYERARRFKQDFGYDFVQWEGSGTRKNVNLRSAGYLFAEDSGQPPAGTIAGACAFWRNEEDETWELMWAWIAPRYQRRGILERRWPGFLERHGDFAVCPPFSAAMHAFLLRHGTPAQKEVAQLVGFEN